MTIKKIKPRVPNRLYRAIIIAVEDLIKIENDPRYAVNMGSWHLGKNRSLIGKCEVCFAGAMMAKTCKTRINLSKDLLSFGPNWSGVFRALDSVRTAGLNDAIHFFYDVPYYSLRHKQLNGTWLEHGIPFFVRYQENKEQFKSSMLQTAAILRMLDI